MASSRSLNPTISHHKQVQYKPQRSQSSSTLESKRITKNPLKKRRRDLIRLLQHADTLPADVRVAHERELASCISDLETAKREARRSQMIKKYHMVRFFERKKATRLLKKARQRFAQANTLSTSEAAILESEVHNREVDLNYTLFFPLEETYSSLYAAAASQKALNENTSFTPIDEERVDRGDSMWKAVEAAMVTGQLQLLREGKLKRDEKTNSAPDSTNSAKLSVMAHLAGRAKEKTKLNLQKPKEEKSHRMKLLERQEIHGKGGARLARKQRRAEEREQRRNEAMSSGDEEDGAGFFEK